MIKNYFKIAFRNLVKHRVYSMINILGLAAGLACFILVGMYVIFETSFDQYHANSDRIYRLAAEFSDDDYDGIAKVTAPWGEAALGQIPEVENMTRFIFHGTSLMRYGDKRFFESDGFFADSSVFEMFTYPLVSGNPETALTDPNSIVIDTNFATRYFGNEKPIGKTIIISEETEYTVTGVMEPVPANSHFTFDFLVSLNTYTHPEIDDWVAWNQFYTYVQLRKDARPEAVSDKMLSILEANLPEDVVSESTPFLQPLTDIHLKSNLWREIELNSDISSVFTYGLVGLFILMLACINFVNLMTARASTRQKEVGIRKTIGADRSSLIFQFLGESLIITFFALAVALFLVDFLLPSFTNLSGSAFERSMLLDPGIAVSVLGVTLAIGILSGLYPAFVLSSPSPSSILKGGPRVQGSLLLRKGLVVFQFSASVALICSSLVMQKQFQFIQNKNIGFDKEQIVNIPIHNEEMRSQREVIKERFNDIPGVMHVSFSGNMPGGSDWGMPYSAEGIPDEKEPSMRMLAVDHDFIETFGMNVVEGRGFSREYSTDVQGAFILNQEAARQLGWENDALGKTMSIDVPVLEMQDKPVIGIVEDFHFRSMKEKISPLFLFIPPDGWLSSISVKIEAGRTSQALAGLEEAWGQFDPVNPITINFFDEQYGRLHQVEENAGTLLGYLTIVAIVIACFGLFGLVTFSAERRTKEIGIRKILGSSVRGIIGLLSKEYLMLVSIGFSIGIPVSWFWISGWLNEFAYKTEIGAMVFALTFILTVTVAMGAVGYQAIKAALMNPVNSLRSE